MLFSKIKLFFYILFVLPHLICYAYSKEKQKINQDINSFSKLRKQHCGNYLISLYKLLVLCPEFRNVFYMRIGPHMTYILVLFLKKAPLLCIGIKSSNCGGGFLVQHGNSTIVIANSVGQNFWVNQNVTVGWTKHGCPTIGNNERIGTGAEVLGPIIIGDNVNIGAGAIEMKNVPSNCTVVSPHAYIVKKDGIKVNISL